jgi:hypothetical protein
MDYMKATEHLKELRGETETLAGHQAATSFLLSESFIQYLESDTEYAYILADKDGDGIIVRGKRGEIGSAKEAFSGAGWVELNMNLYISAFEKNGFVKKASPKEWLTEGADYVFLTIEDYAARALSDKAQVGTFADELIESKMKSKDLVSVVMQLLDKWGFDSDTFNLIAIVATISGAKKTLEELDGKYQIVEKLKSNSEQYEELFLKLQQIIGGQYIDDDTGYPTKGNVKKYVKKIAVPLEIFGYGFHCEGLKTMFHCFHNDAVEGIGLGMYQDNAKFMKDDFPYYDGIENDNVEFWDNLNIESCLK